MAFILSLGDLAVLNDSDICELLQYLPGKKQLCQANFFREIKSHFKPKNDRDQDQF